MTIYAKYLLATTSAMLLVNSPSNNKEIAEPEKATYDVEKLIVLTKRDIRDLEFKIDSMLIEKGDSLIIKRLNNGAAITQ